MGMVASDFYSRFTKLDIVEAPISVGELMDMASIDVQGLIPKSRLYVHLSSDPETAKKVGSRHGRPVIYTVDCAAMTEDGYEFCLSANKVWLTKNVPAKYLRKSGAE